MRFLDHISKYLAVMGIPGLLIISFLDSAAVPLAGGPDAVIILLACARPSMAFWIALAATAGSTFGSLILYGIGYKGGEKALARFSPQRVERMEKRMRTHGVWAIILSVIAPPPFPTKLVILAAGVMQIGKIRFSMAVFIGRLVRYFLLALLAAQYGNQAMQVIKEHYPAIFIGLVLAIFLFFIVRTMRRRRKPAEN